MGQYLFINVLIFQESMYVLIFQGARNKAFMCGLKILNIIEWIVQAFYGILALFQTIRTPTGTNCP